MFENSLEFGERLFAALVIVLCAGVSVHICVGFGSKKAKDTFIALILLTLVGVQMYHLIFAATFVPASRFYTFNVRLRPKWFSS